ncbi:Fungal specific transcription factor domain-containing protein 2 [Elsinoe fawcettii]|nr:Fungal specific transcription factor domain-containing protein 2 [Elsinoe fawcettii]
MEKPVRTKKSRRSVRAYDIHGMHLTTKQKIKCDELRPQCTNCARRQRPCAYGSLFKWCTKHERGSSKRLHSQEIDTIRQRDTSTQHEAVGSSENAIDDGQILIAQARHIAGEDSGSGIRGLDHVSALAPCYTTAQADAGEHVLPVTFGHGHGNIEVRSLAPALVDTTADVIDWDWVDSSGDFGLPDTSHQGLDFPSDEVMRLQDPSYFIGLGPTTTLPSQTAADENRLLMSHYYNHVCKIISCFSSKDNPFRLEYESASCLSGTVRKSMLSAAAAHLSSGNSEASGSANKREQDALEELSKDMRNLGLREKEASLAPLQANRNTYETLLSSILLGMTSSWHNPSAIGYECLKTARKLFQMWSQEQTSGNTTRKPSVERARETSFIVGAMAYWEMLNAVVTDQSMSVLDYLTPFQTESDNDAVHPNPWTGISTPVFVMVARAGVLVRQARIVDKLSLIYQSQSIPDSLSARLSEAALTLHEEIMQYHPPPKERVVVAEDFHTPIDQMYDLAQIYRLVGLLELSRTLLDVRSSSGETTSPTQAFVDAFQTSKWEREMDLATVILTLLSSIPSDSATRSVLTLPLVSAGTTLRNAETATSSSTCRMPSLSFGSELRRMRFSASCIAWWREQVRKQMQETYQYVGLTVVLRCTQLIETVWRHMDDHTCATPGQRHWVDVMSEERMETLLG